MELRVLAAEQLSALRGQAGEVTRAGIDGVRWVLAADVLEAPVDEELVLLDPTAGTYFGVNESGAGIWRALRTGGSAADVAAELSACFDVGPVCARADVDRFVGRLESAGLIRRCPQA
jgi:hypothetical protein